MQDEHPNYDTTESDNAKPRKPYVHVKYRCAVTPYVSKSGLRKVSSMTPEELFNEADKIEARQSNFSSIEKQYVLNAVNWLRNEVNKVKSNEDTHNQRPE